MIALSTVSVAVSSFVDVVDEVERSRTFWADVCRRTLSCYVIWFVPAFLVFATRLYAFDAS